MARPEDALQENIVTFLRLTLPGLLVFAILNEGQRKPHIAGLLKRRGMLPGIPDLCLVADGGQAYFLEVKTPRGRLNENQKALVPLMVVKNIPRATVRSIRDVEVALRAWRLL